MSRFFGFFLLSLFFIHSASSQEELLKESDINKVMEEIFQQHVDKKSISAPILKDSLKNYIEQFDPEKIYLLEEEVRPYIQPSEDEMEQMLSQYKQKNLSTYKHLNKLIQNSILRARDYRKEISNDPTLQKDALYPFEQDGGSHTNFAKNLSELKSRIRQDYFGFLDYEKKKYGTSSPNRKEKLFAIYNTELSRHEDQYLAVNEEGKPLPPREQENIFVLHVLKSLAGSLDSHTKVLNSNEAFDMKVRLEKEYQGYGIDVRQQNGKIIIGKLIKGGPADKSQLIKEGDQFIEINGRSVEAESIDKVLEILRDNNKKTVTLTLKHAGETNTADNLVKVTLKRGDVTVNEGRVEYFSVPFEDGIIGSITLHSFYQGPNGISSERDVREAIKQLQAKGQLKGLILDIRDNMGGFLTQAVKVAGLFISDGIIVISKYYNGEQHIYRDVNSEELFDGPLVILTSKETASAAEIVAQALQDYGVAIIVGDERTYGKGTIQSQTVTGGSDTSSYFKVTVGKYYTVSGKTPQLNGVQANIVVPSQFSREAIGEEYLEYTEKPDTIPPVYDDKLADVEPALRPWYLRYYAPKLQQKKVFWLSQLPELQKKSEQRIRQNPAYQKFLVLLKKGQRVSSEEVAGKDLQMDEAIQIVKDMITIESTKHNQE